MEQFYADDRDNTREKFLSVVDKLKNITEEEWFIVRNYKDPPPVLAALMSAVCTLMLVRDNWKSARNLVGSSVQNMEVNFSKDWHEDRVKYEQGRSIWVRTARHARGLNVAKMS